MSVNTFSVRNYSDYSDKQYSWISDLNDDYKRMKVPNDNWTMCSLNENYYLCETYPKQIYVPLTASHEMLMGSASYRSNDRLPVFTYLHSNEASISRCGQPISLLNRCTEDEKLVSAIQWTNSKSKYIVVVVEVSEDANFYENVKFKCLGIERIHVIRASLQKLLKSDLHSKESSIWLKSIKAIMDTSYFIANAISEGVSVLVHCLTGFDSSAQVCAIAALMLDPFYRTIKGFRALIYKEFLAFGFKFNDRCGFNQGDLTEISPLFTQFLDCVFQMMQDNMLEFEFNELFLLELQYLVQSCQFPTFIGNCEKERLELQVWESKFSLWKYVTNHLHDYINSLYAPQMPRLIRPNLQNVKIWREIYRNFDESLLYIQIRPSLKHQSKVIDSERKNALTNGLDIAVTYNPTLGKQKICSKRYISWKTKKSTLQLSEKEWLYVFDQDKFCFKTKIYVKFFVRKLNTSLKNIDCLLKSAGKYSSKKRHVLRFKCRNSLCSRTYNLCSINSSNAKKYEFVVNFFGKIVHDKVKV